MVFRVCFFALILSFTSCTQLDWNNRYWVGGADNQAHQAGQDAANAANAASQAVPPPMMMP